MQGIKRTDLIEQNKMSNLNGLLYRYIQMKGESVLEILPLIMQEEVVS